MASDRYSTSIDQIEANAFGEKDQLTAYHSIKQAKRRTQNKTGEGLETQLENRNIFILSMLLLLKKSWAKILK